MHWSATGDLAKPHLFRCVNVQVSVRTVFDSFCRPLVEPLVGSYGPPELRSFADCGRNRKNFKGHGLIFRLQGPSWSWRWGPQPGGGGEEPPLSRPAGARHPLPLVETLVPRSSMTSSWPRSAERRESTNSASSKSEGWGQGHRRSRASIRSTRDGGHRFQVEPAS